MPPGGSPIGRQNSNSQEQPTPRLPAAARAIGGAAVFVAVCGLAAWWQGRRPDGSQIGHWYGIAPPLGAIVLAFATRRVLLSLALAVCLGGLLLHWPETSVGIGTVGAGLNSAGGFLVDSLKEPANLQILLFVPPMFAMVLIVADAGGFDGILVHASKIVRGRRSAQFVTALAGVFYFFDDYSNAMVVGSAMRPVTDRYRISREKLAFLVDSTSAPIAGLAVISTWIMYEVTLFDQAAETMHISNSGYSIFLDVLPYRFYCLFILSLVFVHILLGRDFGPMQKAQQRALEEIADVQAEEGRPVTSHAFWVALLPLAGLLMFHFIGIWYDGGGLQKLQVGASAGDWTYWREVISSAEHTLLIFDFAALFGLCLAMVSASCFVRFPLKRIADCLWRGFAKSVGPCLILTLAWSLKNCCDALGTDDFLVALLADKTSPAFLPAFVFLIACLTSFTTGTSWGTMAILIPVVGPVAFQLEGSTYGLVTMMSLGAVLDGAIFGDHCSPISDTTILSSTASECDLIQHVRTQIPYSILGGSAALVCGYVPVAMGLKWLVSLTLGLLAISAIFFLFGKRTSIQARSASE